MKATFGASVVACAAMLAASPLCAQQTRLGAIVLTVRDATDFPISNALVSVSGPATRSATTSSAGLVTLLGLPPGTYTVRVIRSGFEPSGTTVRVGTSTYGVTLVPMQLVQDTFATIASDGAATTATPARGLGVPYVATALSRDIAVTVLSGATAGVAAGAPAAPVLEGTLPGETRLELDGIPLAGNAHNAAALRYRDALDLDGVSVAEGPALAVPDLDNAIGGIVEYRTPRIATRPSSAVDLGGDSAFGNFEHVRFSDTFGTIGVLVDGIDGENGNTATVVKGALALSRATSLELASYSSNANDTIDTNRLTSSAPAYAADFRTTLGSATFAARAFGSSSGLTLDDATTTTSQALRTRGYALSGQIPFGENLFKIAYEHRTDEAAFDDGPSVTQAIESLDLDADLQVSRLSRLSVGDDVAHGTYLPLRNDPHAQLALRTGGAMTVTLAAGSAYETVPDELLATSPAVRFAPESSFGYRAGVELAGTAGERFRASFFALRRFDVFAPLAEGRSLGMELGYTRPAVAGGLGVEADLGLVRSVAYGPAQPLARYLSADPLVSAQQLADVPYSKARLALDYETGSTEFGVGATMLGANNGFAAHAVMLGDLSMRLTLGPLGALRLGLDNLFGVTAADPELAALFPPREFTVTLQR